MTIPNIDNWRRFTQGSRFGAQSLAEIYSNPIIARKVVFNLMDGLIAQYAGGPQSQPNYAVHHATLYASKDPVALDASALRRLEQWRVRASLPAIGHTADYVDFASALGLGNAAPNRIEIRKIGRGNRAEAGRHERPIQRLYSAVANGRAAPCLAILLSFHSIFAFAIA